MGSTRRIIMSRKKIKYDYQFIYGEVGGSDIQTLFSVKSNDNQYNINFSGGTRDPSLMRVGVPNVGYASWGDNKTDVNFTHAEFKSEEAGLNIQGWDDSLFIHTAQIQNGVLLTRDNKEGCKNYYNYSLSDLIINHLPFTYEVRFLGIETIPERYNQNHIMCINAAMDGFDAFIDIWGTSGNFYSSNSYLYIASLGGSEFAKPAVQLTTPFSNTNKQYYVKAIFKSW